MGTIGIKKVLKLVKGFTSWARVRWLEFNFMDWGKVSTEAGGLQRFAYNLLRHYLLWLVREVSVLIIIGKALYNVRHVEWGGKQFQLRGAARSASVEQKLNEQGRKKER